MNKQYLFFANTNEIHPILTMSIAESSLVRLTEEIASFESTAVSEMRRLSSASKQSVTTEDDSKVWVTYHADGIFVQVNCTGIKFESAGDAWTFVEQHMSDYQKW